MTSLVILMGAVGGLGLLFLVLAFLPRRAPGEEEPALLAAAAEAGESRSLRASLRRMTSWLEQELRGKSSLVQDARMVGRSLESHVVAKITGLIVGAALLGGGGYLAGLLGLDLPPLILVAAAALGALGGWWLPDSFLKTEADKERKYFQQVTESWLELAGQLVTAGSDTFAALVTAASYSEQPVFRTLRDALRVSAARGEPPWTGLRRLADGRRLRFLDPFCAALELAGTTGAGSRETILSQVEAARSKAMHEADAAAASAGEKMGAPLALIGAAFMIIMGYPPLAGIMDGASLGGPGL
ncbi:MAG: type II secretion system F family protein [bacterium]|nr:type II secretion system F family protein [bacterium]